MLLTWNQKHKFATQFAPLTEIPIGATERPCREETLYTNALMVRNIELYLKLGYRETGRRPNTARPGFTIVDMEKMLDDM
ncbi:hypothetical protein DEA98_26385 [Brucella pseudogrignonensis]|nr:hypothetical protein [Brucella pseudogrignonensis]